MSRANPTASSPNPSSRWFEWKGKDGLLSYYDKNEEDESKRHKTVPLPFKFIVLDVLSTVTGYNKKVNKGIYANEVRNTGTDPMVVKFHKGEDIANGLWLNIKKDVMYDGGKFAVSLYIAFREHKDAPLQIGNIRMVGCARSEWFDFYKKSRADVDKKAVVMKAGEKDTSGSVDFIPPILSIAEITPETNAEAQVLADNLAIFLKSYLKRPLDDTLDQRTGHDAAEEDQRPAGRHPADEEAPPQIFRRPPRDPDLDAAEEDDIPF